MLKRAFYGWKMVAALWALEFVNMGFPFYGGGVINTYMLKHMAMNRSMYGLGFTLLNLFIGVLSPLIVLSILKVGLRGTFVIGSGLICLGACWMSFIAVHPWQYLFGFGVLVGSGVGFGTTVPLSTGVTRWFRRSRGKAMAIAFSASGFAGFICVPAFNKILTANGGDYKSAWLWVALFSALGAVSAWLFVKEDPASLGQFPDGLALETTSSPVHRNHLATTFLWTPAAAYRTSAYWIILIGAISCQFPFFFFNAHALLHMRESAVPPATAAWALGSFTAAGILGRFVGGWLLDRIDARFVFMLGIAGYIVGSVLATHIGAANVWLAFATAACYGWGFGCSWISFHTITGNFFGVAAYPKLNGTLMILSGLVCAPAGIVGGKLFDTYHSYAPAFHLNLMISVVGILALSFAKMPVHPESVPDAKTETWCAGQQERLRAALCGSEVSNGR